MGFFGLFGGGKSAFEKHAERVAKKRAQSPDRWESIQWLGKLATDVEKPLDERGRAVSALMVRFTYYVEPTITDGEEKEEAFRWVCGASAAAIDPICAALREHESPSWSLRALERLTDDERVVAEMVSVLGAMDTEYSRDPQKKLVILGKLEEMKDPSIAPAVAPFFMDMNEGARFLAVGAALVQENADAVVSDYVEALVEEESLRVKIRILDGMIENGWSVGKEAKRLEGLLPEGFVLDAKGVPRRGAAPKRASKAKSKRKR